MKKIEKLELEYDDWKRDISLGSREMHIIIGVVLKVNEIIDYLNQSQKQPEEKCIHDFPLSSEGVCEKCGIKFEDIKSEKQEEWRKEWRKLSFEIGSITKHQADEIEGFISERIKEAREEAKIQQLREDIEQVEVFLPEKISDTPEYWIPTQILLELEKDLSKLLKEKE